MLFSVLVLLVAAGAMAVVQAIRARSDLLVARGAMQGGRAALVAGDVEGAHAAFTQAEQRFTSGLEQVRSPLLRLVSFFPMVGRTVDTVDAAAEAGGLVAEGAQLTTTALQRYSEGPKGLAPKQGAIPLEPIEEMAPILERAQNLTTRASAIIDRSESTMILGQVAEARAEFVVELADAERVLRSALALTQQLPEFLGADGTRRYFFGAQNPAELRGTGGLIGAYSILTVRDGRLDFGPFEPIQSLPNRSSGDIPPPNDSWVERWDQFGGNWFWLNINMTPDFPSAATAIERLYEEVEGEELDGTIVADPFALRALVASTGPVAVEGTDVTLDSENTVPLLAHDAYAEFTDAATRKLVLGESAKLVFEQFLNVTAAADPAGAARTLIQTAADGQVLLHAVDPEIQAAFELVGAAGKLRNPAGDYLGVFSSNAAANKADYFLEQTVRYRVQLHTDGSAEATASVRLKNEAPAKGESAFIIGPYNDDFDPGQNKTYLSTYCAASCGLESFEAPRDKVVASEIELEHPVFSVFVDTASKSSSTLRFDWTLPNAWDSGSGFGSYTLMYQGQNTIRPTRLVVDIRTPDDTSILGAGGGLQVRGDRAVWEGEARHLMRFELALAPSSAWGY